MVSVLTGVSSWRNVPVLEKVWFLLLLFIGLDTAFSANFLLIIYIDNNAPDPCGPARCLSLCSEIYFNLWFTITSQAKHKTCVTTNSILIWIMKITAVQILWLTKPFLIFYLHFLIKTIAKNEASAWTKDCEVDIRPDFDGLGASYGISTLIYLP